LKIIGVTDLFGCVDVDQNLHGISSVRRERVKSATGVMQCNGRGPGRLISSSGRAELANPCQCLVKMGQLGLVSATSNYSAPMS
jgi:hypothetical protein